MTELSCATLGARMDTNPPAAAHATSTNPSPRMWIGGALIGSLNRWEVNVVGSRAIARILITQIPACSALSHLLGSLHLLDTKELF